MRVETLHYEAKHRYQCALAVGKYGFIFKKTMFKKSIWILNNVQTEYLSNIYIYKLVKIHLTRVCVILLDWV